MKRRNCLAGIATSGASAAPKAAIADASYGAKTTPPMPERITRRVLFRSLGCCWLLSRLRHTRSLALLLGLLAASPAWADAFSSPPPGCSTNCTFTTPTLVAPNATGTSGYQYKGNTILWTNSGTVRIGEGAGSATSSTNNFDVYIGYMAGHAQTGFLGENTVIGWSNCSFCVNAVGATLVGVASGFLETASGNTNQFGNPGGLNETCVGADSCRNQVESSYISTLGRRSVAYGNVNNVSALGYQAIAGNSAAITVTGTPTAGANVTFQVSGNFTGSPQQVSVTIPATPTVYSVASAVAAAFQTAGSGGGPLQVAVIGADAPNATAPAPAVARISMQGTPTVGPILAQISVDSQTDTATYTITGGLVANGVVAIGDFSLLGSNATSLVNVIGIGSHSAQNIASAANDVVICHFCAGTLTTGSNDFIIGSLTTDVFSGGTSTAVLIGNGAKAGTSDIVIGSLAGGSTGADGLSRVIVGVNSFFDNTTGASNTGVGFSVGQQVSTGGRNSFFGFTSGQGINGTKLTGNNNSGYGASSLAVIQGTANNNTAIGQNSLGLCTTCATVTSVGSGAGSAITTGNSLAIFGSNAGNKATTLTTSLILGANVASGTLQTGTGNIVIGVSATADLPSSTNHTLLIQGNGSTATLTCTGLATTPNCTFGGPLASTGAFSAPSVNNPSGNLLLGSGTALTTNATTGFVLVPSMAGTPTGSAGSAGQVALVVDTTNKKICYNSGSGWECSGAFTP